MYDELSFDIATGVGPPIKGKRVPIVIRVPPEQYILGEAYNFRLDSDGKTYFWSGQRPKTIEGDGWAIFRLDWANAAHEKSL